MKVSQEQAQQTITDFVESNILGSVILFALITYVLEPLTSKVTDWLKDLVKKKFGSTVRLNAIRKQPEPTKTD